MIETNFGLKELYDVVLKATYNIDIGTRQIQEGEVIAEFDKIQIASINEIKMRVPAQGGYNNRVLIMWDQTKEIHFNFSQGIFSKTQFALLSNSKLISSQNLNTSISINKKEIKESNENGEFELKEIPNSLFIYNKETGERITEFNIVGKLVRIPTPYLEVIARYLYEYNNEYSIIKVGQRLIDGYVQLEGKTRLKDDNTGQVVTGLIKIPRLKLMSDLSMRLGEQASPVVADFSAIGYPVGKRGNEQVFDIVILTDDIDSDL
jgi:hypothetical protein